MGDISFGELFIIIALIVIFFGPDKLPSIARDLGQGVRKMRGAVDELKTEIFKETGDPVAEIKKEIEKIKYVELDAQQNKIAASRREEELKEKTENSIPPHEDPDYTGSVSR